jgi:hypothetical protein
MEPVRLADEVFALTSNGTVPLPDPLAVHTVTHARGVVAIQPHPAPVYTLTANAPPDAATGAVVTLSVMAQLELVVKVNGFDGSLSAAPSGPTALTRASKVPPDTGQPATPEAKS